MTPRPAARVGRVGQRARLAPTPPGYWAAIANTRWGLYITALEREALEVANARADGPSDAIDIGCGDGRWTAFLAERGWAVTSIDVDAAAIVISGNRTPTARHVLVEPTSEVLPVEDRSVALALGIEVNVVHRQWFPGEAARVLKPGGVLVGVAWNSRSVRGVLARARARFSGAGPHPYYFEPYDALTSRLRDAGFAVVQERGLCWFPFGRSSNSPLVPAAVALERWLGLSRVPRLSPWVLFTAERVS